MRRSLAVGSTHAQASRTTKLGAPSFVVTDQAGKPRPAPDQFEFRMYWYGSSYVKEQTIDYASVSTWSQTFSCDPFGNLTKNGSITWNPGYNQSNNRYTLAGTTYDAAGNLLNDTFHPYTWNVYGRPATIDGTTTLTYDANDRMIERNASGTYSEFEYGPTGEVAQMSGQTQTRTFVPLPGGPMLYQNTAIWHPDWLGSMRLSSSISARTIFFDKAYAPFGELYNVVTGATDHPDFTGLRQDSVAGEYDTPNRLLHPNQGRWISPDPAGLAAVDLANPQSLNRYPYVTNSPLNSVDRSGLIGSICQDSCEPQMGSVSFTDWGCLGDCSMATIFFPGPLPPGTYKMGEQILPGENSLGWPLGTGSLFGDIWQDALGLPTIPCAAQFGPWCDPSKLPNPWILEGDKGGPSVGMNIWHCPDGTGNDPCAAKWQAANQLNNPCTIGTWYAGSALSGGLGAAVANSGEIATAAAENYPSWIQSGLTWLQKRVVRPGAGAIAATRYYLKTALNGCNAMAN